MCKSSGDPGEDDLSQPGGAGGLTGGGDTNRILKIREKLARFFKIKGKKKGHYKKRQKHEQKYAGEKWQNGDLKPGKRAGSGKGGCVPLQELGISGLLPTGSQFPNSPTAPVGLSPVHTSINSPYP